MTRYLVFSTICITMFLIGCRSREASQRIGKDEGANTAGEPAKTSKSGARADSSGAAEKATAKAEISSESSRLNSEGERLYEMGDYRGAIRSFEQLLPILKSRDDAESPLVQDVLAHLNHKFGDCFRNLRNYSKAMEHYSQSLILRKALGDKEGVGYIQDDIFAICTVCGLEKSEREAAYYSDLADCFRKSDKPRQLVIALRSLSAAVDFDQGLKYAQESDALEKKLGIEFWALLTNKEEKIAFFKEAIVCHNATGDIENLRNDRVQLGLDYWALGRYTEALDIFAQIK